MEQQLARAGVRYSRWPALRGSPELLHTHAAYFARGVERHLYLNRSSGGDGPGGGGGGTIGAWGTIGTYLSHHTLFEHIVKRHGGASENATFLILQDDTQLNAKWLPQLAEELNALDQRSSGGKPWERLLLVWWGLSRPRDCRGSRFCTVRPPAGPTEAGQADCCGKRFYHGLQAWLVRTRGLRCLLRRLKRRRIKNIDAQMVQCHCPRTYALPKGRMLGRHLDRELGSERAAVNSVWKAQLAPSTVVPGTSPASHRHGAADDARGGGTRLGLRPSAQRNLRKTQLTHLVEQAAAKGVRGASS